MRDQLSALLESLETELRSQGRWSEQRPPVEALCSTQPFAVDTLTFDEWLQWILLPRLHDLLAREQPLPTRCAIQPMAEEVYGADLGTLSIVLLIGRIDALLSDGQNRLK